MSSNMGEKEKKGMKQVEGAKNLENFLGRGGDETKKKGYETSWISVKREEFPPCGLKNGSLEGASRKDLREKKKKKEKGRIPLNEKGKRKETSVGGLKLKRKTRPGGGVIEGVKNGQRGPRQEKQPEKEKRQKKGRMRRTH